MTSTDDVAGLCDELRQKAQWRPDDVHGDLHSRSAARLESQANALREMENERDILSELNAELLAAIPLEKATLKDWQDSSEAYRKDCEAAESERGTLRARLKEAEAFANKIIEMNVQYAKDRYGDAAEAESMACVRAARAFIHGGK